MDTAASRIRELRVAQGLSLQQLADRVGASKPQIDKLEKGTRRLTEDWIRRIAEALGVTAEEIASPGYVRRAVSESVSSTGKRGGYGPCPVDANVGTAEPEADTPPLPVSNSVSGPVSSEGASRIPLLGYGSFSPSEGRQVGIITETAHAPEWIWRPEPLDGIAEAYAVRMPDGSMAPKYEPGQILFVHPRRTPRAGDAVVVRLVGRRFLVGRLAEIGEHGIVLEHLEPAGRQRVDRNRVLALERIVLAEEP